MYKVGALARSQSKRDSKKRNSQYVLYAIPLIVIALFAIIFLVFTLPARTSTPAMNFTFSLVIQESNRNGSSIAGIVPSNAIGEAGGYWRSTQFNSYSVDSGHYPIYMDQPCAIATQTGCATSGACSAINGTLTPPCTIHVKSNQVYNFTLGDFFNVWGQTLGPNNTLGAPSSGKFVWQLCIGPDPSTARLSNLWEAQPLQSNESITLFYVNPSNTNTPGCAAL